MGAVFGSVSGAYAVERNLYKSLYGHKIRYEEINHDLQLVFAYTWAASQRFGFVKRSTLRNAGSGRQGCGCLTGS